MKICVPSWNRAGDCVTRKWLPHAILVVAESQRKEYLLKEGEPLGVVPDEWQGHGKALCRNYILDNVDDEYLVMLDDDMAFVGYNEGGKQHKLKAEEFLEFLGDGFRDGGGTWLQNVGRKCADRS